MAAFPAALAPPVWGIWLPGRSGRFSQAGWRPEGLGGWGVGWRTVGRPGGETRTIGGGKQVSFFGGTRAAGACGWEEEKCQLPLFVLKQRQKRGASPQPCLQMQVTCVPEGVLGGHQRRWQPRRDGANHRVIV